jgi:uncharacterized membrane protein
MHRFGHHWIYRHPWGGELVWWPGMLVSALSTLFLIALCIGLVWALLRWILPSVRPMLNDIFGMKSTNASALDILRQRYAAGEIDTFTFQQMRERLLASYQQESNGIPRDEFHYQEENWTGYRNTYSFPASQEQGRFRMAEQEQYMSDTDM